jgi:hypothetical protein
MNFTCENLYDLKGRTYIKIRCPADCHAVHKIRHRTALLLYQLSSSDSLNIITFRDVSFDCSSPHPFVPCTLVPCLLEEVRSNEAATVAAIVPRLI